MKKISALLLLMLLFSSCEYFSFKKEKPNSAVARVNNSYLYQEDLNNILGENYSKEDSVVVVQNFIKSWIKHQLLLEKAQINLDSQSDEFEVLVKKYKEDLFINAYKEAVVNEYLDTVITQNDIHDFYTNNKENFILSEDIVRVKYIKIGKNYINKERVINLFKSSREEDLEKLKNTVLKLSAQHLDQSVWVSYSNLINKIPIFKTVSKEELLKNNNFIQKEDSISIYLLAVKQVVKRNEIGPQEFVFPTIKKMIIHNRKMALLKSIEETLLDDASKKEQFEIY